MEIRKVHCLFEQSGTFKKEFLKLGVLAEDYDILNDFGETDNVIDLFRGQFGAGVLVAIKESIEELPPAEPKRGKWINGKCSDCSGHAPFWAMASTYYESNFCPNCGAKMEVIG